MNWLLLLIKNRFSFRTINCLDCQKSETQIATINSFGYISIGEIGPYVEITIVRINFVARSLFVCSGL